MNPFRRTAIFAALALAACAQLAAAQVVEVAKTATCGCCTAWVDASARAPASRCGSPTSPT